VVSNDSRLFASNWGGQPVKIGGANCGTITSVTDTAHLTLSSSTCTQGVTTIQLATQGNENPRQDMYYLTLNANPLNDTWHQVTPVHFPAGSAGSTVYDPDDDVLFSFGYDLYGSSSDQWIYCRTAENPTPGTPTARQLAAGCVVPDDWNEINHGVPPPAASQYLSLLYHPGIKKVILYGGFSASSAQENETWTYDVPTHAWTRKCQGSCVAPPVGTENIPIPAIVYNDLTQKVMFHQSSGAGAPADWEYDAVADTWSRLTSAGGSSIPTGNITMSFDSAQNKLIGWVQAYGTTLWQGSLSDTSTGIPATSPCDLNADGTVDTTDVQLAIAQALGTTGCVNAALHGTSACNVVDVQRVINASRGAACRTGQ
jgi:hypothetical protein